MTTNPPDERRPILGGVTLDDLRYDPAAAAAPDLLKFAAPILAEAAAVVRERGRDYGPPQRNHQRTADLWSAYLGTRSVTPADVVALNILQKLARAQHRLTRDTALDIAGYAANLDVLRESGAGPDQEPGS